MKHLDSDLLWSYVVDDLDSTTTEFVQQHLAECPSCERHYKTELVLHQELFEQTDDAPSLGFSKSITLKLQDELSVTKAVPSGFKIGKYAIIGAMVIAIVLPLIVIALQRPEIPTEGSFSMKSMLMICSMCLVLWALYGVDRAIRLYGDAQKLRP